MYDIAFLYNLVIGFFMATRWWKFRNRLSFFNVYIGVYISVILFLLFLHIDFHFLLMIIVIYCYFFLFFEVWNNVVLTIFTVQLSLHRNCRPYKICSIRSVRFIRYESIAIYINAFLILFVMIIHVLIFYYNVMTGMVQMVGIQLLLILLVFIII